jgi:uncharacterized protein
LGGFKVDEAQLQRGVENLKSIIRTTPVTILEHHALRDEMWRQRTESLFETAADAGHRLVTAAEYSGKDNVFLESKRKHLYKDYPPSEEFKKWTKLESRELNRTKPPV